MTLDEAIRHAEEVAEEQDKRVPYKIYDDDEWTEEQENCHKCAVEHRQLAEWLKDYKRMLEQTQWLPVSERLPKENGRYLCTVGTDYRNPREMNYEPKGKNNRTWASLDRAYVEDCFVIAWMPLPKPYREDGET